MDLEKNHHKHYQILGKLLFSKLYHFAHVIHTDPIFSLYAKAPRLIFGVAFQLLISPCLWWYSGHTVWIDCKVSTVSDFALAVSSTCYRNREYIPRTTTSRLCRLSDWFVIGHEYITYIDIRNSNSCSFQCVVFMDFKFQGDFARQAIPHRNN